MQCADNLKQLTLAWHSYSDACGTFPLNYQPAGNRFHGNLYHLQLDAGDPSTDGNGWALQHVASGPTAGLCDGSAFVGELSELSSGSNGRHRVSLPLRRLFRQRLAGSRSDGSGGPDPLWAVNDYKACSGANWFGCTNWPNTCPAGRWAMADNALLHCNGVMCSNSEMRCAVRSEHCPPEYHEER